MKVVIVGAAGFVGKYLVRELEAAGHSIVKADLPEVNLQNAGQVEALIEGAKPDAVVVRWEPPGNAPPIPSA